MGLFIGFLTLEGILYGGCVVTRHKIREEGVLLCYLNLQQRRKVANGPGADLGGLGAHMSLDAFAVTLHVLYG